METGSLTIAPTSTRAVKSTRQERQSTVIGLEPIHLGTKTLCLTVWLHRFGRVSDKGKFYNKFSLRCRLTVYRPTFISIFILFVGKPDNPHKSFGSDPTSLPWRDSNPHIRHSLSAFTLPLSYTTHHCGIVEIILL